MALIEFQPLRVASGWTIEWNTFMETDPNPDDMSDFSGSSLLHARNDHAKRAIDLKWRPEEDYDGEFILQVIDLYEEYNPKTKKIEFSGIWEEPYSEFTSKSRLEIVEEIERLMIQLPPYVDPRIMKSPGVVDEIAEPLRLKLEEHGISDQLSSEIMKSGNKILQDILIDNKTVRKTDLEKLIESGASKGIKKKASQKLNSKAFRTKKI